MSQQKRKRASPWFVLSGTCFIALVVIIALSMTKVEASVSVRPNPQNKLPEVLLTPEELVEYVEYEERGYPFPIIDWEYWESMNPEIVAWVTIPETSIDYAVVQAPSNNPTYYLSHDIYKNWNPFGCPYIDADCAGLATMNIVIYGHNMGDGTSMFSELARYNDETFAREHPIILFQTRSERIVLEVSAVDVVNGYTATKRTGFDISSEFHLWYQERLAEADVVLVDVQRPARVFTFVTCSYNYYSNERTLVYAIPQTERNAQWQNCQDTHLAAQADLSASFLLACLQQRLHHSPIPTRPMLPLTRR